MNFLHPGAGPRAALDLSVVIPAFNEEEHLAQLVSEVREGVALAAEVSELGVLDWELILVDDGSHDGTGDQIQSLARRVQEVQGVYMAGRQGQSAALVAGFQRARGRLIATMDADRQNDPRDLPALFQALAARPDCVAATGYRVRRRDPWLRRVSSRTANRVRNALLRDSIRDSGCGLKLVRASALGGVPLFDGFHRFLPTLLRMQGAEVVQCPVQHRPRLAGRSSYGVWNRVFWAGRDLVAVRWMIKRSLRPQVLPRGPRLPGEAEGD